MWVLFQALAELKRQLPPTVALPSLQALEASDLCFLTRDDMRVLMVP